MFLVDTNIVSAVAPTKRQRNHALEDWFVHASDLLYLSVVTAAEIRAGILKAQRQGATAKATSLDRWWGAVEHLR